MKFLLILVSLISFSFGADLGWNNDYKKALEEAKAQNKDVYMLVVSSDCRWCRKFEATTAQDKSVIERLKKDYVFLVVNRDKDYIPKCYNTKRVPRHYFIDGADGKHYYTFLGAWESADFHSYLDDAIENKGE